LSKTLPQGSTMSETVTAKPALAAHGSLRLPSVDIDSYNIEAKDEEGFVGDRASKGAFREMIEDLRRVLRKRGEDPLGDKPTQELTKKELDQLLKEGDVEAAGVLHGAIEEFAQELAGIIRIFLKMKGWRDTQRVVVGGGLRGSRVGELAIGRAEVLLKTDGIAIDLTTIRNDPDEAGLIGAAHLAPSWIFKGHDSILAVDIGGTNIRAGVVQLGLKKAKDLSAASVWDFELWRHADEDKLSRDEAVDKIAKMLRKLIKSADKEGLKLAPFIGIGCPGRINDDGSIERGAQNLPGNWESSKFNLPTSLSEAIGEIDEHDIAVIMHNDAVVQGLSELPFMQDVERWGVLTIGTGLGNARFTNRSKND
jgi:predicted NBD/HSP70 family sugar kinase